LTDSLKFIKSLKDEIEVTPKKIRDFGWVMFAVLIVIVPAFISWRNDWIITDLMLIIAAVGLVLWLPSLVIPKSMTSVYRGWMLLAILIGLFMTKVIITLVYFGMMTPIGLVRQWIVKDPMKMKTDPEATTYWVKKESPDSKVSYEKQY
jgi:hypothetical protein